MNYLKNYAEDIINKGLDLETYIELMGTFGAVLVYSKHTARGGYLVFSFFGRKLMAKALISAGGAIIFSPLALYLGMNIGCAVNCAPAPIGCDDCD